MAACSQAEHKKHFIFTLYVRKEILFNDAKFEEAEKKDARPEKKSNAKAKEKKNTFFSVIISN